MTDNELDRILSSNDDDILPSSGLVACVMDAVRSESATPPPISFPWKRAVPGLAAAGFALVWLLVVATTLHPGSGKAPLPAPTLPPALVAVLEAAAWSVVAVLVSLVTLVLSMRLASR
jgi:hypothetical protein